MVYLVIGNRDQRQILFDKLFATHGVVNEQIEHRYKDDVAEISLLDSVELQSGLFGDTAVFMFHELASTVTVAQLQELVLSENIFFFVEEKVNKKVIDLFTKGGVTIHQSKEESIKKPEQEFNVFGLADALGERDKKKLWLYYRKTIDAGISPEEINGILLWQLRNLAMVIASPEGVPDMKPFVYTKTRRYAKNFNLQELTNFMTYLTDAFHNRDTYDTLDVKLERIILEL